MGAGPGDFGAERVLGAPYDPSVVTLIALTANVSGVATKCCYSAKSETSVPLIGANSNGYNSVFGISRFVQ